MKTDNIKDMAAKQWHKAKLGETSLSDMVAMQGAIRRDQTYRLFELAFVAEAKKAERIDQDISLAFGYRFGKLAVAKVDPKEVKPSAASKPKFSF